MGGGQDCVKRVVAIVELSSEARQTEIDYGSGDSKSAAESLMICGKLDAGLSGRIAHVNRSLMMTLPIDW